MEGIKSEGILSALFFLTALIFLIINDFGILTIPGILSAVVAIYLSLTGRYSYSACLGVITSFGSFLAQHIIAFCSYCTISATAFLIGGICSLLYLKSDNTRLNFGLIAISILAVLLLLTNLPHYEQQPIVVATTKKATSEDNKALLYISPNCKSCKTIADQFILIDPEGESWQPVIVPAISLAHGEYILRDKGYKGEVKSSFSSPTRFVPLLEIDEQYYTGEQITTEKIWKEAGS